MNIKKMGLWILCGAMFCTLLTHANAQEAYSSVGPNYGKLYNSTGSSSTPNYGATTNPSDRVAAQQSGLGYSQPATTVNQSTASANVPGYTNTPPSNLTSGFGGASLFPQGKSNITRCAATGSGSTNSDPECNAVNFLANNPGQKITLSSSDPTLKTGADIIGNASSVSPTNSQTCSAQNQAVAGTYSAETCNEYLKQVTQTCNQTLVASAVPGFTPATVNNYTASYFAYNMWGDTYSTTFTTSWNGSASSCPASVPVWPTTFMGIDGGQCMYIGFMGGGRGQQISYLWIRSVTPNYSCQDGSLPVDGQCKTLVVSTSWSDGCAAYESSAGVALPVPQ